MQNRLRVWLRNLFRRSADRALDRELEACIEILTAEKIATGVPAREARRQALIEIGSMDAIKERIRDGRPAAMGRGLARDLRTAARSLATRWIFAATATVSLALGVAGATAVYSWGSHMFDRLPGGVPEPHRLAAVFLDDEDPATDYNILSLAHIDELRASQTALNDLAATIRVFGALGVERQRAREVTVELVSGNFFSVVNVPLALGRGLLPDDDLPGARPAVVLNHRLWRDAFAGTPDVVGRTIRLNGHSFTVVGVATPGFDGLDFSFYGQPQLWATIHAGSIINNDSRVPRRSTIWRTWGRLRPGVEPAAAEAALNVLTPQLSYEPADNRRYTRARVVPVTEARVPSYARTELQRQYLVLLVVAVLLLAAGCFNIANFLISQGITRQTEMGVRMALGATRLQIFRQLIVESSLLGVAGGVAGLALAGVFARAFEVFPLASGLGSTLVTPAPIDIRAALFASAVALAATLVFGLLPAALTSTRSPIAGRLGGLQRPSRLGIRWRQAILGLQVALSIVLAVSAALFGMSLLRIEALAYPYASDSIVLARVNAMALPVDRRPIFYEELLRRVRNHGTVEAAGLSFNPLLAIGLASVERDPGVPPVRADYTTVGSGFFATIGVPVLAGREFRPDDNPMGTTIINATLANLLWPGEPATGRTVRFPRMAPADRRFTVVGVVDQPRCRDRQRDPGPCVYWPARTDRAGAYNLHVRTAAPAAFAAEVAEIAVAIDSDVVVDRVVTLREHLNALRTDARGAATMTGATGILAGLLSAIGCGSLLLSLVRETRREIAIRLALGSGTGPLVRHVMLRAVGPYAAGLAFGVAGAWLVAPTVSDRLFETGVHEPAAFALPALSLLAVGLIAAYWPTRVASRTSPAELLRE